MQRERREGRERERESVIVRDERRVREECVGGMRMTAMWSWFWRCMAWRCGERACAEDAHDVWHSLFIDGGGTLPGHCVRGGENRERRSVSRYNQQRV